MKNPVTKAREHLGISRRDLALLSNSDYHLIHSAERGLLKRPPVPVMRALAALGVDADSVADEYRQYREMLRSELIQSRAMHRKPKPNTEQGQQAEDDHDLGTPCR